MWQSMNVRHATRRLHVYFNLILVIYSTKWKTNWYLFFTWTQLQRNQISNATNDQKNNNLSCVCAFSLFFSLLVFVSIFSVQCECSVSFAQCISIIFIIIDVVYVRFHRVLYSTNLLINNNNTKLINLYTNIHDLLLTHRTPMKFTLLFAQ